MSGLHARTLAEARLYVDLVTARYGTPTSLEEGPESWTMRFEAPGSGPAEIVVPYQSESEARRDRVTFGHGTSRLIDCGQWRLTGAVYANRALEAGLRHAMTPHGDPYDQVLSNWDLAVTSVGEAAAFLPEGDDPDDEVPDTGFWTILGAQARQDDPEQFTREGLSGDLAFYRQNRDDFVELHG